MRSGATGATRWKTPTASVLSMAWLDGDDGHDAAILRFEDMEGDDEEFADARGLVEVLRDRDWARIWQKAAWYPAQSENATASWPSFSSFNVGDTNSNGIDDVLIDLDTFTSIFIICTADGVCSQGGPDEDTPLLRVVLLADGADGSTLYAYRPLHEGTEDASADVEVGEAGKELLQAAPAPKEDAPMPALVVLLAALLLTARASRR